MGAGLTSIEIIVMVLIVINVVVSYRGFNNSEFFSRYLFGVDQILTLRQYDRMVTSAFLHVNWMHLGFNMYALYAFSSPVSSGVGLVGFLIIYAASLLGGNLLALFFKRNQLSYTAVGNSGAVSGIVFASIALYPEGSIGLIILPGIGIPSWIFGLLYLGYTLYGVRSQRGNIGHEAHLGGAITGILLTLLLQPIVLTMHPWIIAGMLLPFAVFMYIAVKHPHLLTADQLMGKRPRIRAAAPKQKSVQHSDRKMMQLELDMLLEKVSRVGIDGLNEKERKRLEELSKRL